MRKKMLCKAAHVCMAMGLAGVLVCGSGVVSPGAMEEYPKTEAWGTQESVVEGGELELAE